MNPLAPDTEIDGFRLGELVHTGSMASIYRLTGPAGVLPLIMKVPRLGSTERSVNVIAFEVCRTVLGSLAQSVHYPTLVAYGDLETTPYLVMEHVEGKRLNDWTEQAPVAPEEVARLGAALAFALHELHRQDVVHLDLKPTNVLYRTSGEAVLIDFGLAHHAHYPDLLAEELRFPVGNWVYMAPEQIVGVRSDPRSDIYALGGMLYQLVTGRLPFGNPGSVAQLRRRLYRDPIPPRAIMPRTPPWLQEAILHCLELDARDRYASAAELAFDLANPPQIAITERGMRERRQSRAALVRRWIGARGFEPSPSPPSSTPAGAPPIVMVAIDTTEPHQTTAEALRGAVRRLLAADDRCRIACVMAVPPSAKLSYERYEETATGRHIRQLVHLRRWAKPLELPEERVTYHVLESDKPAAALIDYARMNDVDQIVMGASRGGSGRLFPGVSAQVVTEAPCSVTVVRERADR